MTTPCRYTDDGYVLNDEHYDNCDDQACPGCYPCVPRSEGGTPLGHCAGRNACTEHLTPDVLICPKCVGKTRTAILDIVRLERELLTEAIHRGVDSEAANLAGPADPIGWSERKIHSISHGYQHTLDDDDPYHPRLVLGRWDMMLREDYGQPTNAALTLTSAAKYLTENLTRIANDPEQDWALLASEVFTCRAHLEAVLHDSRTPEKGVPCPACVDAGAEKPPRLTLRRADHDHTGASDEWRCPDFKGHVWTDAEYRLRVGQDHLEHAAELTASQIRQQYRVKEGSVRGWASTTAEDGQPMVRKRGKSHDGLTLYDVTDVLAVRDGTRKAAKRDNLEWVS